MSVSRAQVDLAANLTRTATARAPRRHGRRPRCCRRSVGDCQRRHAHGPRRPAALRPHDELDPTRSSATPSACKPPPSRQRLYAEAIAQFWALSRALETQLEVHKATRWLRACAARPLRHSRLRVGPAAVARRGLGRGRERGASRWRRDYVAALNEADPVSLTRPPSFCTARSSWRRQKHAGEGGEDLPTV